MFYVDADSLTENAALGIDRSRKTGADSAELDSDGRICTHASVSFQSCSVLSDNFSAPVMMFRS